MEEQNKELQDYLVAIRKRKTGIITILLIVLLISALVAFLLPSRYKSSATILIEQQEIPQELVMSTVTSYAAERIQVIQARVMSRSNLMGLVEKYNLYQAERKYETTEEIMERLSEDINLDIISAEVVDPRTGRPSSATIAFSLSFESESAAKAQKVANELTSLYLNENLKSRTQKAEDTSVFFQQETERLSQLIESLEEKLAIFKQDNAEMLPGLEDLNQQMLQRKETDISNLETRLIALEDKKFYLNGQLALIDPGNPAVPGAQMRLKALEAEYTSAKARYAADHPDVKRLKSEIDALRLEVGAADSSEQIAQQLTALRGSLVQLKEKYTADHPDVKRAEQQIATLEQELKDATAKAEDTHYAEKPDNPAYITLEAQLAGVDSEIKSIKQQKLKLQEGIRELEDIMQKAPQVEREFRALARDYDNATREYQETKAKQVRADAAKQLEAEKKGERFTLIDPPALPERPFSPNRPAILFLGLIFSIGSGLGFAFVADAISGAVRGAKSIHSMLGVAPLAVIPYQLNMVDVQRRKRFRKRTVLVGVLAVVSALLLIHFLISPLDVLWFRVLRKLEIFTA